MKEGRQAGGGACALPGKTPQPQAEGLIKVERSKGHLTCLSLFSLSPSMTGAASLHQGFLQSMDSLSEYF